MAPVARRYAVNANMVFKWLRNPRYAPEVSPADAPTFLPVEIVDQHRNTILSPVSGTAPSAGNIEIELAGGHPMRISGKYDPEAPVRPIRGLTA